MMLLSLTEADEEKRRCRIISPDEVVRLAPRVLYKWRNTHVIHYVYSILAVSRAAGGGSCTYWLAHQFLSMQYRALPCQSRCVVPAGRPLVSALNRVIEGDTKARIRS